MTNYINDCVLMIARNTPENRQINGKLANPPVMYVMWFDAEMAEARCERISFGAARALAPEKYAQAMEQLGAIRDAEDLMAAQIAADEPPSLAATAA